MRKNIMGIAVAIVSAIAGTASAQYYKFHDPVSVVDFTMPVGDWTSALPPYPGQIVIQPASPTGFMMNYVGTATFNSIPLGSNAVVWESDRQTYGFDRPGRKGLWGLLNPPFDENIATANFRAEGLVSLVEMLHPNVYTSNGTNLYPLDPASSECVPLATAVGVLPPTEILNNVILGTDPSNPFIPDLRADCNPLVANAPVKLLISDLAYGDPEDYCPPMPSVTAEIKTVTYFTGSTWVDSGWRMDYNYWRNVMAAIGGECAAVNDLDVYAVFTPCRPCPTEDDCDIPRVIVPVNFIIHDQLVTCDPVERSVYTTIANSIARLTAGYVYEIDGGCYLFEGYDTVGAGGSFEAWKNDTYIIGFDLIRWVGEYKCDTWQSYVGPMFNNRDVEGAQITCNTAPCNDEPELWVFRRIYPNLPCWDDGLRFVMRADVFYGQVTPSDSCIHISGAGDFERVIDPLIDDLSCLWGPPPLPTDDYIYFGEIEFCDVSSAILCPCG